jgi:transcriptional regulator with XRE-family HTH domain
MNGGSPLSERHRHSAGHPHPVDVHVGSRLRQRRTSMGMSQEKLGDAIGLTFQQVQKYERGTNRIGASRLFELSRVLDVPVGFFFEEIELIPSAGPGMSEAAPPRFEPQETKREQLELARIYQRIGDSQVRRRLFELARAVARAYFPKDGA